MAPASSMSTAGQLPSPLMGEGWEGVNASSRAGLEG
jgi:hypothetical protein